MRLYFLPVFTCLFFLCGHSQLQRFSFSAPKMGSPFTIIFFAGDSAKAATTAHECFALVDSLVAILTDYADSSELNRLCARSGYDSLVCSPVLYAVLWQSKYAFEKSGGSFDITLGPVTRLWRKARKEKIFPPAALVKEKLALTGFSKVYIDSSTNNAARLQQAGMQLRSRRHRTGIYCPAGN